MHRWLLAVDGMSKSGVGGIRKVVRDWDGKMGCLDFDGVRVDVPHALAHLSCNLDARNYDSSGLGPVLDVIAGQDLSLRKISRRMQI